MIHGSEWAEEEAVATLEVVWEMGLAKELSGSDTIKEPLFLLTEFIDSVLLIYKS